MTDTESCSFYKLLILVDSRIVERNLRLNGKPHWVIEKIPRNTWSYLFLCNNELSILSLNVLWYAQDIERELW